MSNSLCTNVIFGCVRSYRLGLGATPSLAGYRINVKDGELLGPFPQFQRSSGVKRLEGGNAKVAERW